MKKIILTLGLLLAINQTYAQEFDPNDAVRFSQNPLNGSARFNAMGGAFGAIGSDISSLQINPAGSAVNFFNVGTITGQYATLNNRSHYLNNENTRNYNDLDLNNMGAVFVFDNPNENSKLKKTAIGLVINNDMSHDNEFFFGGVNTQSLAQYFLGHANYGYNGNAFPLSAIEIGTNNSLGDRYMQMNSMENGFSAQQAMLGYESFIINHENGTYTSNVGTGPYEQNATIISSGMNGKLTANVAFDINDTFFVGANLNYHSIDYTKLNQIYEYSNQEGIENGVNEILFTNIASTYGHGFSFNVGALAKVTPSLRVAASYQSPTWYSLNDEFEQHLETRIYEDGVGSVGNFTPGIVTLYDTYRLRTPGNITGSLAYVFGKSGLISFDYSRKDYSSVQYKDDFDSYSSINTLYSNELKATNEFRIGGEYRIKQFSIRGGYRFAETPYKNEIIIGDLTNITGGLGYTFGNKRVDLAYVFAKQPVKMYYVSSGLNSAADITMRNHMVSLSYNVYF